MSTWNYRLVVDDTNVAALREVYYDDAGHISGYTEPLDVWPLEDLDLILRALCGEPLPLAEMALW